MRLRTQFAMPLVCALLLLSTGCCCFLVGAAAGGAGYAYSLGRLKATKDVPLQRAYDASVRAVNSLGLRVTTKQCNQLEGEVTALGASNKETHIKLKRLSDSSTELTIYNLPLPDQAYVTSIYDKITSELGGPAS